MNVLFRWATPGALLLLASGCGTLSNGRRWGQDATLRPGWRRVGHSALRAALDPQTWGSAVGAVLLQVDHADERISEWAVDHTPVFGSPEKAEDARGWTGRVLDSAFYASLAATPSGPEPGPWLLNKARGGLVEAAGLGLSSLSVDVLKDAAGRTRPNAENDRSFPSSHAARSAADVTLAIRNLRATNIPPGPTLALQTGLYAVGAVSSWSRVEAEGHYPSDVLAGWAVGHFCTSFIHDAFLSGEDPPFWVEVRPAPEGLRAQVNWSW